MFNNINVIDGVDILNVLSEWKSLSLINDKSKCLFLMLHIFQTIKNYQHNS